MMANEAWLIISTLAGTIASLAVYIARLQAERIRSLEIEVEQLRTRLETSTDRTTSTASTLERVVNAAVDRERQLIAQLAEANKKGGSQ